jgi:hypothetical protein
MSSQNLIIYKFKSLYHILEEICFNLNFKVFFADNKDSLNNKIKDSINYLIISDNKSLNINNLLILNNLPINIFKLLEKINIELLKIRFNNQAEIKIKNYSINLNSREMFIKNVKLKLNKSVSIAELQEKVWDYQYNTETHTVETHIYRLRKKIFDVFNDNDFINSEKDGYQIKQS